MSPKEQPRYTTLDVSQGIKARLVRDKRKFKKKSINDVIIFLHQFFDKWSKPLKTCGIRKPEQLINQIGEQTQTSGSMKATRLREKITKETTERVIETFNYETWYCDCSFGTYIKDKRKVLCDCTYPSIIKRGRGKGRLIDPQICAACLPRIQGIQEWIANQEGDIMRSDFTCPITGYPIGKKEQLKVCSTCRNFSCDHHPTHPKEIIPF